METLQNYMIPIHVICLLGTGGRLLARHITPTPWGVEHHWRTPREGDTEEAMVVWREKGRPIQSMSSVDR